MSEDYEEFPHGPPGPSPVLEGNHYWAKAWDTTEGRAYETRALQQAQADLEEIQSKYGLDGAR